jgi:hypothetical protein
VTRSTVSRGCPKGFVWRRKIRTLARILGLAMMPELGSAREISGTLVGAAGGVAMASEAARERKHRQARTPNRPGANSTGREPSLTTKPRLVGGTPASASGTTRNEKNEAALRFANAGVDVLGCTGMRMGCMARACTHRRQDHRRRSERRQRHGDQFTNKERDGWLARCTRGAAGCDTYIKASQHGTKVVLHTAASAVARGDSESPRIDMQPRLKGRAPKEV